jgi:hypothetical protein
MNDPNFVGRRQPIRKLRRNVNNRVHRQCAIRKQLA